MKTRKSQYMSEVDGLRAVAVIVIILFHLNHSVPYGYIGVDLFFVISGFVVTRSIYSIKKADWSDVLSFYTRRIKRIFPALYLTVIFGSLVSLYTINAIQLKDVQKVGVFGLFGMANWKLLFSAKDYFGHAAEYNPFTHLWSLGVEEQFYILVAPIILLFQNTRIKIIGIISIASFITYIVFNSDLFFYATSHRLWELGSGVLLALCYNLISIPNRSNWLTITGSVLIIQAAFLGFQAEISTIAGTLLCIISFKNSSVPTHFIFNNPVSVLLGKLSYSLYLWHWPIFVFFRMTYGLEQLTFQFLAFLTTLIFASLSYYWVEKPLRYANWGGKTIKWQYASAFSIVIILSIAFTKFSNKLPNVAIKIAGENVTPIMLAGQTKITNDWADLGRDCRKDYEGISQAKLFDKCLRKTSNKPTIFLVGDSHATQLKFAFEKITKKKQKSQYDFKYAVNNHLNEVIMEGVVNDELKYLLTQVQQGDLVFVAIARGKFQRTEWLPIDLNADPLKDTETIKRIHNYSSALTSFAHSLEQKGGKLVLVESGPKLVIPASAKVCFARLKLTSSDICSTTTELSLHDRKPMSIAISKVIGATTNTMAFDFHEIACPNGFCKIFHGEELFMVDGNHISKYFSENYVAPLLIKFLDEN